MLSSSMSIQSGIKACPNLPTHKSTSKFFKTPNKHQSFSHHFPTLPQFKIKNTQTFSALAESILEEEAEEAALEEEAIPDEVVEDEEELVEDEEEFVEDEEEYAVNEKTRVVLKFIWMEKNIGIGLNQLIPGHGMIPLSPYYFWPRKDAWEELKTTLESKPWISQKKMIILLNQATDIINLWQQSGGNLSA